MGLCREAEEVGRAALNLARQVSRTSSDNVSLRQEHNNIMLQITCWRVILADQKFFVDNVINRIRCPSM